MGMKSGVSQQGSWRTTDGSAWWLRDGRYNDPNGDYHANCYLHIYDVNPNNVRFNDGSCGYYSSEYLCQRALKSYKCSPGSPSNCKLTNVPVNGYSPGQLARVDKEDELEEAPKPIHVRVDGRFGPRATRMTGPSCTMLWVRTSEGTQEA